jgi:hypothetical protein
MQEAREAIGTLFTRFDLWMEPREAAEFLREHGARLVELAAKVEAIGMETNKGR